MLHALRVEVLMGLRKRRFDEWLLGFAVDTRTDQADRFLEQLVFEAPRCALDIRLLELLTDYLIMTGWVLLVTFEKLTH